MTARAGIGRVWRLAVVFVAVAGALVWSSTASAEVAGTGWEAFVQAYPTDLLPGGTGTIQIFVINTGALPSNGSITVTDRLPPGVVASAAGGMFENRVLSPEEEAKQVLPGGKPRGEAQWSCTGAGTEFVTCTSNPRQLVIPNGVGATFHPFERVGITVQAEAGLAGSFVNNVTIAGGEASEVTKITDSVTVSGFRTGLRVFRV